MPHILAAFDKGDAEVLDFTIDWSTLLGDDTITTSAWIVQTGLTQNSATHTLATTTVWLSAGIAGVEYTAQNTILTAGGRTHVRTLSIIVLDR